jgi:hypothetical protein
MPFGSDTALLQGSHHHEHYDPSDFLDPGHYYSGSTWAGWDGHPAHRVLFTGSAQFRL